jgi:hypothetical protein
VLAPTGRLILHEHACDRLDEPTTRWYLEHRTPSDPDAPTSLESRVADWEDDHAGPHGYAAMRVERDTRDEPALGLATRRELGHSDTASCRVVISPTSLRYLRDTSAASTVTELQNCAELLNCRTGKRSVGLGT